MGKIVFRIQLKLHGLNPYILLCRRDLISFLAPGPPIVFHMFSAFFQDCIDIKQRLQDGNRQKRNGCTKMGFIHSWNLWARKQWISQRKAECLIQKHHPLKMQIYVPSSIHTTCVIHHWWTSQSPRRVSKCKKHMVTQPETASRFARRRASQGDISPDGVVAHVPGSILDAMARRLKGPLWHSRWNAISMSPHMVK